MKQYFAKYLPVEDEIGLTTYDSINGELPGSQPVKLFLCSRDIQVGDEYYTSDFQKYKTPLEPDEDFFKGNNDRFKVIGEISPNAKWVKEGDEFDENQILTKYKSTKAGLSENYILYAEIKCLCCETFK